MEMFGRDLTLPDAGIATLVYCVLFIHGHGVDVSFYYEWINLLGNDGM